MQKLTNFKFQSVSYKLLSAIFLSVCIIFSICVYHSFAADVPCKINYQGRLIKDNVPVHNPTPGVPMTFKVDGEDVYSGGNVPVYNGLFRVVLDLEGIDWTAGEEKSLEVTVDGEQLTPPEPIYAYPYAINSHLLEGSTKEYFLNVSDETQKKEGGLNIMGDVGIGTTSPGAKLDIGGTAGTDGIRFPDGTMQFSGFTPSTYTGEESVTFPNGLIMKFGNTTVSGSNTIVTFASAFPHACVTVVACGGNPTDTAWDYALYTSNLSKSSFKLRVRIPARQTPIRWIALGY